METENRKYIRVALAVVCLVGGYLINRSLMYLAQFTEIPNPQLLGTIRLSAVLAAGVVVGLFFYLVRHEPAMLFLTEVVGELKKVVWPTRKETTLSTVVVIVLVFVTAVLLWVFDLVWAGLVRLIVS